jgi:DNA replication protein DnaC
MFSQWSRIFRDEMATAAAVDRLVHHAVILEFNKDSYRGGHAARRALQAKEVSPAS